LHVHRFCPDDVQFDDALVSSAIVIFEKSSPGDHHVTFSLGGSLLAPAKTSTIRQSQLLPAEKWTGYIDRPHAPTRRASPSVLFGDLFTIKRGLATGNNKSFILPRERAQALGIPKEFLRPILPSPRLIDDPIIEADDDGYPKGLPRLALIDCRLTIDAIAGAHPRFFEYLRAGTDKHIDATYLTSRRTPWYSQEDRPPPPFLCTYMGRNANGRKPFRFLWNKSQATAHNVYLLLYPKEPLRNALLQAPGLAPELFDALRRLDTDTIKKDGRVYGGGLFKMEPKELAAISADFLLAALGSQIQIGDLQRQPDLFDEPGLSFAVH
jgi:adenine-specific DNA-methyltransferase